jgi:hypothetical protein
MMRGETIERMLGLWKAYCIAVISGLIVFAGIMLLGVR